MTRIIASLTLSLLFSTTLSVKAAAENLKFGEPVDPSQQIKISTLMANPQEYVDQTVTIAGTVVGVCEKRGCWMTLASDKRFENLKLKVRDGVMEFPMSARGKQALATGKLTELKLDLQETKDYRRFQASRDGERINADAITEPMSLYQVVPVGVEIVR